MLGAIGDFVGGAVSAVGNAIGGGGGGLGGGAQDPRVAELQGIFDQQQQIALDTQKVTAEGNTGLAIAKTRINT